MTATALSQAEATLAATGLLDPAQARQTVEHARANGLALAEAAEALGLARETPLLEAMAGVLNLPFVRVGAAPIERNVLDRLPARAVFQYRVVPWRVEGAVLRVAARDPYAPGLADALRLASGLRVRLALSPTAEIEKAIKTFYGVGADTLERMIQDDRIEVDVDAAVREEDLADLDQEASVVKFVNQIIAEAFQDRATDIHLEPMETDLRVRYRIDGVLHQAPVPPQLKRFQAAILSRVKVMAGMDIAEKRLPQDGRISLRIRGEELDVRVSTMPTVYGESVSLRLLLRGSALLGMNRLGLEPRDEELLRRLIRKPHGILLVTGPTGSGKSTSLYAWLHTINSVDKRILTVEDPIEYEMAGVNQIHVRPDIGLTFAVGLRHILRQDPDVIMVGEVRDKETAEIAIRAALTGHLVFSTLHTNDAAGAVTRLLDMGIEPFLVASSIEGLVAQRLVRRLCPQCRRPWAMDERFLAGVGFPRARLGEGAIYEAAGCEECRMTGFRGRTGIYEIMPVTEALRPLIVAGAGVGPLRAEALRRGMRTLRDDGWNKVLAGITTVEEVLRVTEADEALAEA